MSPAAGEITARVVMDASGYDAAIKNKPAPHISDVLRDR